MWLQGRVWCVTLVIFFSLLLSFPCVPPCLFFDSPSLSEARTCPDSVFAMRLGVCGSHAMRPASGKALYPWACSETVDLDSISLSHALVVVVFCWRLLLKVALSAHVLSTCADLCIHVVLMLFESLQQSPRKMFGLWWVVGTLLDPPPSMVRKHLFSEHEEEQLRNAGRLVSASF